MGCPICDMRKVVDRLEAEARAGSVGCFIAEDEDRTTVTVYGAMTDDHRARLLALLSEINTGLVGSTFANTAS